ncbi:MAG TPA: hypothetical protein VEL76_36540 [Gemmataceae bacterium]|nr:hypothetical protein [Gemmataceae bacterium]
MQDRLRAGSESEPPRSENAVAAPSLASLSRLAVTDADEHFSDADVTAVANAAPFAGLRVLQLTGNDIGSEGARALATSPHLRNLEFRSLAHNPLRSVGVAALANSANLSGLTFLDLWFTEFYDGIQALAGSPHLGKLRTLFLDRNDLGPDALVALASSSLRSLSALDLADNQCGLEGLRALTASPLHSQLRVLDLTWTVFEQGDEAAEGPRGRLNNPGVRTGPRKNPFCQLIFLLAYRADNE